MVGFLLIFACDIKSVAMTRIVLFLSIFAFCQAAKLPDYFPKCSKEDPNLNECVTKSANAAWSEMIKGDKAHHIQELNPFFVPFLRIKVDQNLQGNLTESTISGLSETKFDLIKLDLKNKMIDAKFSMPRLNFAGGYEVSGQLLFLPLEGKGPSNITFLDMVNDLHIEYELKEKSGKKYMEIGKSNMKYTTSRAHFRLDNLFGGDERLGEAMNNVLDESWEAVNEEVGARVGEAIGVAYTSMLQSFFRKVPIEEFFTD